MKRQVLNRAAKLLGAVAFAAVAASLVFGQVREAGAERRDSSLSQDAEMALWNRISSSIRLHTPGPMKHTAPVPPASASAKPTQTPKA